MKTRPKLFTEFILGITIAYSDDGCKIICKSKQYVLLDTKHKPWNSPDSRKIFLAKMYIREVLWKANVSKKIQRIAGYELLGRRCLYRDIISVIVDAVDYTDTNTGEVIPKITIWNDRLSHTLKLFINEVQL